MFCKKNLVVMCTDSRFAIPTIDYCDQTIGKGNYILETFAGGIAKYSQKELMSNFIDHLKTLNISKVWMVAHDDCGYYKHVYSVVGSENLEFQLRDVRNIIKTLDAEDIDHETITAKVINNMIDINNYKYDYNDDANIDLAIVYPITRSGESFDYIENKLGIKHYDRYSYSPDSSSPIYVGLEQSRFNLQYDLNLISIKKHNAKKIIIFIDDDYDENDCLSFFFAFFMQNSFKQKIVNNTLIQKLDKHKAELYA